MVILTWVLAYIFIGIIVSALWTRFAGTDPEEEAGSYIIADIIIWPLLVGGVLICVAADLIIGFARWIAHLLRGQKTSGSGEEK